MARFLIVCGVVVVTSLGFFFFPTPHEGQSAEVVAGMPVVCLGNDEEGPPCWLTLGAGKGVMVVGLAGMGIVSFTLYGIGLLFASGQLAAGGIAFGQAGFGASFFLGQAGVAPVAIGQVVGGGLVVGQGALGADGSEFLPQLSAELNAILGAKPPD